MLRRSLTYYWYPFVNTGIHGIHRLPGAADPLPDARDVKNIKYFDTKSRKQWDYQGIDERITMNSQFRDTSQRPGFESGTRPDNEACFNASLSSHNPKYKKLHEYFDEYTRPGSDPKAEAARAAREHWDADEFYYPGESWQRNRPSFRSVPAELLNRQTWYHWVDMAWNLNEYATTVRNRMWNPIWPPPGYKLPYFQTKREFVFGADEPSLISEIERYFWFRNWFENNMRQGPYEWIGYFFMGFCMWAMIRSNHANSKYRAMLANMYYPGRQAFRSFGEPVDWATDRWWWQEPLETWPNQGEIWFMGEIRWKYINLMRKQDEEERLRSELLGIGTGESGFTPEQFHEGRHSGTGNRGHWYWLQQPLYGMGDAGSNSIQKVVGAHAHKFDGLDAPENRWQWEQNEIDKGEEGFPLGKKGPGAEYIKSYMNNKFYDT